MLVEKHMFLDWLADHGAHLVCAVCKGEKWGVLIHDPVDLADQRLVDFYFVSRSVQVPVVGMCCKKCGFLRVHSTSSVLGTADWGDSQ